MTFCNILIIVIGWFASATLGFISACYLDRRRFLNGLKSQIEIARDSVERSYDTEGWPEDGLNAIRVVWDRVLPEIEKTAFTALPYMASTNERRRLRDALRVIQDLDIRKFMADGLDLLAARDILGLPVTTKKEGLLAALDRLESCIR